jgi:hypothetical protein
VTGPISPPYSASARCDTPTHDGADRLCEAWRDTRSALHSSSNEKETRGISRRLETAFAIAGESENSSSDAQTTRLPRSG